jgi:hypothetical protein
MKNRFQSLSISTCAATQWYATRHVYTATIWLHWFGQKYTVALSFVFDIVEFIEWMLHFAGDMFLKVGRCSNPRHTPYTPPTHPLHTPYTPPAHPINTPCTPTKHAPYEYTPPNTQAMRVETC